MPIPGYPAPPTFPPPDGTKWMLQRNVLLHSLISEAGIDTDVNAETTYEVGNNGPIPAIDGAEDYALARLYTAQFQQYLDGDPLGLMAVTWPTEELINDPGTGEYFKVDGGDFIVFHDDSVGSTPTWPLKLRFTVTTTTAVPDGASLGISLDALIADVWAALPASSKLTHLVPTSPALDPEKSGVEFSWIRTNVRLDVTKHVLGKIYGLTWPEQWDDEKSFHNVGHRLTVTAIQGGGYHRELELYFGRIPGDTATSASPPGSETGISHAALFDVDHFDDPLAGFS